MGFLRRLRYFPHWLPVPSPSQSHREAIKLKCVVAYRYHNVGIPKLRVEVWANYRGNIAADGEMGPMDGL